MGRPPDRLEIKRIYEHPRTSDGTRILSSFGAKWRHQGTSGRTCMDKGDRTESRFADVSRTSPLDRVPETVRCRVESESGRRLSWPASLQPDPSRFCMRRETKHTITRWSLVSACEALT